MRVLRVAGQVTRGAGAGAVGGGGGDGGGVGREAETGDGVGDVLHGRGLGAQLARSGVADDETTCDGRAEQSNGDDELSTPGRLGGWPVTADIAVLDTKKLPNVTDCEPQR